MAKIVIGSGKREYIDVKKRDVKQEIQTMKAQLQEIKATFEDSIEVLKADKEQTSDIKIHNQVRDMLASRKSSKR